MNSGDQDFSDNASGGERQLTSNLASDAEAGKNQFPQHCHSLCALHEPVATTVLHYCLYRGWISVVDYVSKTLIAQTPDACECWRLVLPKR